MNNSNKQSNTNNESDRQKSAFIAKLIETVRKQEKSKNLGKANQSSK